MQTSTLFDAKNSGIYGASARTRRAEVSQCGQGERGSIFRDFVLTSFMDLTEYLTVQ